MLEPPQIPGQMAGPRYSEEGLEAQLDLLGTLEAPPVPEVSVPENAVVTCQAKRTLFTRFSFIPVCPSAELTVPESDHPVVAPPVAADARGKGGGGPKFCKCHCETLPPDPLEFEWPRSEAQGGAVREGVDESIYPLPFPFDPAPPPGSTDVGVFAPGDETPMHTEELPLPLVGDGPTHSHGEQANSEAPVSAAPQPVFVVLPRDVRHEPVFGRPSHVGEAASLEEQSPPLFDAMLAPNERIHRAHKGPRPQVITPTPMAVPTGPPLHPEGEMSAAVVPPDVAGDHP